MERTRVASSVTSRRFMAEKKMQPTENRTHVMDEDAAEKVTLGHARARKGLKLKTYKHRPLHNRKTRQKNRIISTMVCLCELNTASYVSEPAAID